MIMTPLVTFFYVVEGTMGKAAAVLKANRPYSVASPLCEDVFVAGSS
jgi:hypothetical protein